MSLPSKTRSSNSGRNAWQWVFAVAALICAGSAYSATIPGLGLGFSPAIIAEGATTTLTIVMTNPDAAAVTVTQLTITLPSGYVEDFSGLNGLNTCGGSSGLTTTSLTLSNVVIPAMSSCTATVNTTSSTADDYFFSVAAGDFQTSNGNNAAALSDDFTAVVPIPPTVTKAFSPASIPVDGISTLTLTLNNPNVTSLLLEGVSDTLPSGLTIANPANATTNCPNAATVAYPGGSYLDVSNAMVGLVTSIIPALGSCTASVSVTAANGGNYVNTIAAGALYTQTTSPADSSFIGLADNSTVAASATLFVAGAAIAAPMLTRWGLLGLVLSVVLVAAYARRKRRTPG